MTYEHQNASCCPPAPAASRVFGWLASLLTGPKTNPSANTDRKTVQVPRSEMERLAGTSPHLLADIGVVPETAAGETSPWRLHDGRHLLVRPPL